MKGSWPAVPGSHAAQFYESERFLSDRFAPALHRLGLRGITDRLDEVPSSVMAMPIAGPTGGRLHRDDLPADERVDADGRPLPPPPGYY